MMIMDEAKKKKKKKKKFLDPMKISGRAFFAPLYGTGNGKSWAEVGAINTPAGSVTVSGPTAAGEATEVASASKQIKHDEHGEYEEWVVTTRDGKEYVIIDDGKGFIISKDKMIQLTGSGDPWEEFRMLSGICRDELKQVVAESFVVETKDSEREIRKLSSLITDKFAMKLKNIEKYPEINLRVKPEMYQVYEGPLNDFVTGTDLVIRLVPKDESVSKDFDMVQSAGAAYYGAGQIIEVYMAKALLDQIRSKDRRLRDGLIASRMRKVESDLVHELTHAYDDFRSSGKYHEKDYPTDLKGKNLDKYYSLPSEVNAYYAQALQASQNKKLRFGDPKENWTLYFTSFVENFSGWKSLSPEQQKRIKGRVYNEYWNLDEQEATEVIKQAFAEWYESDLGAGEVPTQAKSDTRVSQYDHRKVLRNALIGVAHGKESKKSAFYSSVYEVFIRGNTDPDVKAAIMDYFNLSDDSFKFISQELGLV